MKRPIEKYIFARSIHAPNVWYIAIDPYEYEVGDNVQEELHSHVEAWGIAQGMSAQGGHTCQFELQRIHVDFDCRDWDVRSYATQEELILDNIADII